MRHTVLKGLIAANNLVIYIINADVSEKIIKCGFIFVDKIPDDLEKIELDSETGYKYELKIPDFLKNKSMSSQYNVVLPFGDD